MIKDICTVLEGNKGRLPVRKKNSKDGTKYVKKAVHLVEPPSLPVAGVSDSPAYPYGRKFDGYLSQRHRSGPLAITFTTELKGALPRHRGFPDAQIGQILDMSTQLMNDQQLNRPFMFTSLTDGYRWQFFKIIRNQKTFSYQESQVHLGVEGWRLFLGFMCTELKDLGTTHPEVELNGTRDIQLKSFLGEGSSAVVYDATFKRGSSDDTERALVKIFDDSRLESREREAVALATLATGNVKNVPRCVGKGLGVSKYPNQDQTQSALVVQPVASPVLPVANGKLVRGKHLFQLIGVLEQAHLIDLQHRDVKPDNIYLDDEDDIILNDWGSSTRLSSSSSWDGVTPGFCDPPDFDGDGKVRDLRSAVRTAWCFVRNQFPDTTDGQSFWDFFESGDENFWQEAWKLANETKYTELAALLSKIA